jgi:hypothetical protein
MRTTLTVDDDVLQAARILAESKRVSVGKAISDLARKGLRADSNRKKRNSFPLFSVPSDARTIGLEDVRKIEDEI